MSYSRIGVPPPYTAFEDLSDEEDPPPEYEYTFEKPKVPVESEKFEEAFVVERPAYNDKFFTLLFLATIVLLAFLASVSVRSLLNSKHVFVTVSSEPGSAAITKVDQKALFLLIGLCIALPIITSIMMLLLAWCFPLFFVFMGYFLLPLTMFSMAFTSLMEGRVGPAIMFGIFGLFSVWFLFVNFSKLSFTSLVLKIVIEVMVQYPSTLVVSSLSSIFSGLVGLVFFGVSTAIFVDRMNKDDANCPHSSDGSDVCVSNKSMAVDLFVLFAGYFIFEVMENLTHVVISGIFGTWYFFHRAAVKPKNPAWGSFKRAVTYSFGSICFGSLIVSVVKTIRVMITMTKERLQNRRINTRDNEEGGDMLLCALICLFSILEWFADQAEFWIKWFNKFAYSYLALYGKDYLSSAKDTYEIMRYKGVLILISDSLIDSTLMLYSILTAVFSSGAFYLVYSTTDLFSNLTPEFLIVGFVLQLILGFFITKITLNSINSGFITFLVSFCIKPEIFQQNYHDYYVKLTNYYPEISHTVNVPFPEPNRL